MILTFDVYVQDPADNGEPYFVEAVEREFSNATHALHFLAGFCGENRYYIIRNLRI